MADGHRYLQQHLGNLIYVQPTPKNPLVDQTLLNTLLSRVSPSPRPSSKSTDRPSPSRSVQGMYTPGHQPGPNSRLNGGPNAGGRQMPPTLYSHNSQSSQYNHPSHHQGFQPEHSAHAASLGHTSGYSSGIISNSSPYTSNNTLNGHSNTTRGGQAQQINEEWANQLRLHKDAQDAHRSMMENHSGHHFARVKAPENSRIGPEMSSLPTGMTGDADDVTEVRRPHMVDKADLRQEWFQMDLSGQGMRNLSPSLFDDYAFLKELYLATNRITHIPADFGRLRNLTLLELSHNAIESVPQELGMCTSLTQLFLFDNRIRDLPYELGSLFNLEILGIEGNPVQPAVKQILMEQGTKSLIGQLREEAPVPLPPNPRQLVILNEESTPNLEHVKVLTWNILHEKYSTAGMYGYTPSEALSWEYRRNSILQEIRERDADIVCLQEVSLNAMREVFSPELAVDGYKGVQFARSKSKTMYSEKEASGVDGCAVFYKAKKYILLDKQIVDFSSLAINRPDMKSQTDIFNRVMPKDNIGMICFLESRHTGARMIVANAHLAWEPELADVKLVQTAIFMDQVSKNAEKYTRWPACREKKFIQLTPDEGEEVEILPDPAPSQEYRNNTDIPLFICGDYNSTSDSSVYELLAKGRIAPDHPEIAGRQYGSLTRDGIEHPFHLRSSYSMGADNVMPFTNYVPHFNGVIDYIWYSTNSLELISVLGAPDMKYLERVPGFPNYHFPSDHLHLMAEVVIKARKDKKALPDSDFPSR